MIGRIAEGLVPSSLLRHLRALRGLNPAARWTYIQCRLRRMRRRTPILPGTARPGSILFVCHGNIIRSAMAEHLLRLECTRSGQRPLAIRSAGVHARGGRPADSRAIEVAPEFGVSLVAHRATELTPEVVGGADLIVVMDYLNEAELLTRYPLVAPRLRLLGEYLREQESKQDLELSDPYMEDLAAVRACFVRIERGVRRLVDLHGLG